MAPLWAAALRLAIAAPLLLLLVRLNRQRLPGGAALRAAAAFGFLNFGIGFSLLYWSEQTAPSGLASVFFATIPILTALLAAAFRLERLTVVKVVGAFVALAGVVVIFSGELHTAVGIGALAALTLAPVVAALAGVLLKRGPRQPALGANAVGALVALPVCLAGSALRGEPWALPAGAAGWFPIVYLAIMGSIGGFVIFAWLVNHWDLTKISFISVIVPVVAITLGAVVRAERLTPAAWAGSVLVLVGLVIRIAGDRRIGAARLPAPDAAE